MGSLKSRVGEISAVLLTTFLGFHVVMCSVIFGGFESKLIYKPIDRKIVNIWIDLEKPIQDTYFYSRDGVKLNAWYVKGKENRPTIVYCHGQGENISLWQNVIKFLADNGYGVFLIDYRGHGRSEGKPYESGLYIDLESSIKYLTQYEKVKREDIILWGRSLGGAVVADVASRDNFKAVILESTFTNIRDEALHLTDTGVLENKLGFWRALSMSFVKIFPLTQKFQTDKKIHKILSPILIGASVHDTTVPVEMSYKLAKLNPDAKLYISTKGSHHESDWFFQEVLKFLESLN